MIAVSVNVDYKLFLICKLLYSPSFYQDYFKQKSHYYVPFLVC